MVEIVWPMHSDGVGNAPCLRCDHGYRGHCAGKMHMQVRALLPPHPLAQQQCFSKVEDPEGCRMQVQRIEPETSRKPRHVTPGLRAAMPSTRSPAKTFELDLM